MNKEINMKLLKESKQKEFKFLGIVFMIWNLSDGKHLSVDIRSTRYVLNLRPKFKYSYKCEKPI